MIRIYLDWNVISGLKTEKYSPLLDFIRNHKERLLFVYTPAHFNDLMKSYNPDNSHFNRDLDQLEWLCGNHLLDWIDNEWKIPGISPKTYFKSLLKKHDITNVDLLKKLLSDAESDDNSMWNFGKILKSIFIKMPSGIEINDENRAAIQMIFPDINEGTSQWELIKAVIPFVQKMEKERDFYKDYRKSLGEKGLKLPDDAGNWNTEEVFDNIDAFFKTHDSDLTFKKYVNMTVELSKGDNATIYDYFTTAYHLMDLIGFKPDRLPKLTDNLQNIRTDVEHAFFASRCDYFVTNDKNLAVKTKVLYKEFDVFTQVLIPEEFICVVSEKMHHTNEDGSFINEALKMIGESTLIEKYLKENDPDLETDIFEYNLPVYYFDFFTIVNTMNYPEQNMFVLEFCRSYADHYQFAFYTETQKLIRNVLDFFGYQDDSLLEDKINDFVFEKSSHVFQWKFDFGMVQLLRDPDTTEPILIYAIKTNL